MITSARLVWQNVLTRAALGASCSHTTPLPDGNGPNGLGMVVCASMPQTNVRYLLWTKMCDGNSGALQRACRVVGTPGPVPWATCCQL